jgi:D-sedoheptulose 7-phosphate isomerase
MKINFNYLKVKNIDFLDELIRRHPQLEPSESEINKAADALVGFYEQGKKVLVCCNGGSFSDSDHIVGELMKDFEK